MAIRYFALHYPRQKMGYTIDYYAWEEREYRLEFGKAIVGDYATREEAREKMHRVLVDTHGKPKLGLSKS